VLVARWRVAVVARFVGEIVERQWRTPQGETVRAKFMTTTGLAAALGVSVENVYHHIRAGHIPTTRVGRAYLIPLKAARKIVRGYQRNKTWRPAKE
jgi:excisionase family DNA binding protein